MKNLFKILPIVFIFIFFSSCKDSDSVVTPAFQPVVLFSQDSMSLSSSDSGIIGLADSVQYDLDSSLSNIQLDYYMESNGGASGDLVYYGVFLSKPGVSFFSDYKYMDSSKVIDTSITFNVSNYKGLKLKFKVAIERKTDYSFRYVRFRNMKLTQLN